MKIVFVAGFLNNHLLPFCEELSRMSSFKFIATENRDNIFLENRNAIERGYVLHDYNTEEENLCIDAVIDADVVIFGGSSEKYLKIRKAVNKLSFVYSERVYKKGRIRRFYPPTRRILKNKFIKGNENLYILCASSFLSGDIELLGFDSNRCYKFGYLPLIEHNPYSDIIKHKNINGQNNLHLLYVGRLLKLKKIDNLIRMCELLKRDGVQFTFDIIGEGPERNSLENLKRRLKLDNVFFHGPQPIEYVYRFMKDSNILYLSSNYNEGWGAVVNEGLGHGCVAIVTSSCGSARYLIQDGINGFIVRPNSVRSLYEGTKRYVKSSAKESMHMEAYNTIWEKWNASIAAERFIAVVNSLSNDNKLPVYPDGPMSLD